MRTREFLEKRISATELLLYNSSARQVGAKAMADLERDRDQLYRELERFKK